MSEKVFRDPQPYLSSSGPTSRTPMYVNDSCGRRRCDEKLMFDPAFIDLCIYQPASVACLQRQNGLQLFYLPVLSLYLCEYKAVEIAVDF